MTDETRNAVLEAELASEIERRRNRPSNPHLEEAARLITGATSEEELEASFVSGWVERASYRCAGSHCDHHVFADGEVIHRRRRWNNDSPWGPSWSNVSFCEACVRTWHPSWIENRREPTPCKGGCGALVSQWGWGTTIHTCSRRCAEIVAREKRRAKREPRACETCGTEFTPPRSDGRYCSNACRQRAYRHRARA